MNKEVRKKAKKALNEHRKVGISTYLVTVVVSTIGLLLLLLIRNIEVNLLGLNEFSLSVSILNFALNYIYLFLFLMPLSVGMMWFYLDLFDLKSPKFQILTEGFKDYKRSVGVMFFVIILDYLWSLLFIIPGMIKSLAYSQAPYILRDYPEIDSLDALTLSRQMMKGHKWRFLLLNLQFLIWFIPGIIMYSYGIYLLTLYSMHMSSFFYLIFGGIYIIALSIYMNPYIFTANAGFYRELANEFRD
ncbi:MAG: DUF975 family protein [Streptococcaceae bacterium]|nr:DUF975 family protein [Streptococcaceae bacterium]